MRRLIRSLTDDNCSDGVDWTEDGWDNPMLLLLVVVVGVTNQRLVWGMIGTESGVSSVRLWPSCRVVGRHGLKWIFISWLRFEYALPLCSIVFNSNFFPRSQRLFWLELDWLPIPDDFEGKGWLWLWLESASDGDPSIVCCSLITTISFRCTGGGDDEIVQNSAWNSREMFS